MLIPCPWCGDREDAEFKYGGAADIAYPKDPGSVDDAAWASYLFFRPNPKGHFPERWYHAAGCRRWFNLVRDTATHEIVSGHAADASGASVPGERFTGQAADASGASVPGERFTGQAADASGASVPGERLSG